jgi:hypothetical protein
MVEPNLTPRQQKWFASVREGLERETGKSVTEWIAIASACPQTTQRARLAWLKAEHGLFQNRAIWVLGETFGRETGWDNPNAPIEALWRDPGPRGIMEVPDKVASVNYGTMRTARKSFTAWSRKVQFAAARPVKGGRATLGLALPPSCSGLLSAPRNDAWSERLTSHLSIACPSDIDNEVTSLLTAAWERS